MKKYLGLSVLLISLSSFGGPRYSINTPKAEVDTAVIAISNATGYTMSEKEREALQLAIVEGERVLNSPKLYNVSMQSQTSYLACAFATTGLNIMNLKGFYCWDIVAKEAYIIGGIGIGFPKASDGVDVLAAGGAALGAGVAMINHQKEAKIEGFYSCGKLALAVGWLGGKVMVCGGLTTANTIYFGGYMAGDILEAGIDTLKVWALNAKKQIVTRTKKLARHFVIDTARLVIRPELNPILIPIPRRRFQITDFTTPKWRAIWADQDPKVGAIKLAFEVFDLEGCIKRLESYEMTPLYPPKPMGGIGKMTAVKDPDGNLIELTQLNEKWFKHIEARMEKGIDMLERWKTLQKN